MRKADEKMLVTISNDIKFIMGEAPSTLVREIRNDLTLDNPAYIQAEKHGFSTHEINEKLPFYKWDSNTLSLPRGYGADLAELFKEHHIKVRWDDQRLTLPPVDFGSKIRLRIYQIPAVETLVRKVQGGLV